MEPALLGVVGGLASVASASASLMDALAAAFSNCFMASSCSASRSASAMAAIASFESMNPDPGFFSPCSACIGSAVGSTAHIMSSLAAPFSVCFGSASRMRMRGENRPKRGIVSARALRACLFGPPQPQPSSHSR